jgi:hypothetical protein
MHCKQKEQLPTLPGFFTKFIFDKASFVREGVNSGIARVHPRKDMIKALVRIDGKWIRNEMEMKDNFNYPERLTTNAVGSLDTTSLLLHTRSLYILHVISTPSFCQIDISKCPSLLLPFLYQD